MSPPLSEHLLPTFNKLKLVHRPSVENQRFKVKRVVEL